MFGVRRPYPEARVHLPVGGAHRPSSDPLRGNRLVCHGRGNLPIAPRFAARASRSWVHRRAPHGPAPRLSGSRGRTDLPLGGMPGVTARHMIEDKAMCVEFVVRGAPQAFIRT
jgi:hypothetical protein